MKLGKIMIWEDGASINLALEIVPYEVLRAALVLLG